MFHTIKLNGCVFKPVLSSKPDYAQISSLLRPVVQYRCCSFSDFPCSVVEKTVRGDCYNKQLDAVFLLIYDQKVLSPTLVVPERRLMWSSMVLAKLLWHTLRGEETLRYHSSIIFDSFA